MFHDRNDAGQQLGKALAYHSDPAALVLAIPCGGAEVGYETANVLGIPFDLIIARKLPYPFNPEGGFGAVSEDGSTWFVEEALPRLAQDTIESVLQEQQHEIQRRIATLRGGRPLPDLHGETVILVDDGIAMGSTMRASLQTCRNRGAAKVVVAAPVSSARRKEEFQRIADDVCILETPPDFRAVASAYERWDDVPDDVVVAIMNRVQNLPRPPQ